MGKHIPNGDSLKEYRTLILSLLQRIESDIDYVKIDIKDVKKELSTVRTLDIPDLKITVAGIQGENRVKAIISGMLGGVVASGIAGSFIWWLNSQ